MFFSLPFANDPTIIAQWSLFGWDWMWLMEKCLREREGEGGAHENSLEIFYIYIYIQPSAHTFSLIAVVNLRGICLH